ncbi:MAG: hypothetical protein ACOX5Z_10645 [Desulfobulbus sp.]|jgi:hypothetical protein
MSVFEVRRHPACAGWRFFYAACLDGVTKASFFKTLRPLQAAAWHLPAA